MWKRCIRRAWSDTFNFLGGRSLIAALFFIPPVGFALHWLTSGLAEMLQEMIAWAIYSVAATLVVAVCIFLFNLACAPYRIERDRHRIERDRRVELEATMPAASNSERVRTQKSFPLWEAACLLAGTPIRKDVVGEAFAYLHQIKSAMIKEKINPHGRDRIAYESPPGQSPLSAQLYLPMLSREQRIAIVSDSNELARDDLFRIAVELNRRIPGLTDELHLPQEIPSTESKKLP